MRTLLAFSIPIGIAAVLVAAGAWWFSRPPAASPSLVAASADELTVAPGFSPSPQATSTTDVPSGAPLKPPRAAPAGEREYRSIRYRFSLLYPQNLKIKEYDEGSGASTVVFQDIQAAQGFQVFIVPYSAPQVSVARFKEDEPSGTMRDPTNLSIDGASATMFFGTSPTLGDTREVWFIHGGYLFEVTTTKSLDYWLGNIMGSWRFI